MQVILVLGQSGVSNFALVRKKIKEKCPLTHYQSAISNFALYVIKYKVNAKFACISVPEIRFLLERKLL